MADIRNDQFLHRPGAGRGAITPADPMEVMLYGPNGQPISATNRLAVEATLSGSYVTAEKIATSLQVAAGATVFIGNPLTGHALDCTAYSVGVSAASGSPTVSVVGWPVIDNRPSSTVGVETILSNAILNNQRGVSERFSPKSPSIVLRLTNGQASTITVDVFLYRYFDARGGSLS